MDFEVSDIQYTDTENILYLNIYTQVFPEAFDKNEPKEAPKSPRPKRPFRLENKKKKTGGLTFRGKPMKLFDPKKPKFELPEAEPGRNSRKSKKKTPQPPAEPETMETGKLELVYRD